MNIKSFPFLLFLIFCSLPVVLAQMDKNCKIVDAQHYSHVFGEIRNYRIFLPPGYHKNSDKKYPVIYFLHGWSQRYFGSGSDRYSEYDQGEDNHGDNIEKFVSQHDVIVVKSDGYNRSENEDYYVRPYNIGPVETNRQFPIYYEELIHHIDEEYQTLPDRGHRAISGLSMGGFMSYVIAAKYPHLFSAAGSFCGSPEFVIGPKDMPVEYRHLDFYHNYDGMNVRLHYGDRDFIQDYHEDLNRVWLHTMENYSCKIFPGDEHTTSGMGEMLSFLLSTFQDPPVKPSRWTHTDIYPDFNVWNYQVTSDRHRPGFTTLENVDTKGFKISVQEYLPDGQTMPDVSISVLTDTVYAKNKWYTINDYDVTSDSWSQTRVESDKMGRIKIKTNGGNHHIGIHQETEEANLVLLASTVQNSAWATSGKEVILSLYLLNKGMRKSGPLKIKASAISTSVVFSQDETSCPAIDGLHRQICSTPIIFRVNDDDVDAIRLGVEINDEKNSWSDYLTVPIKPDVEEIEHFMIADGAMYAVARGGNRVDTVTVGRGNGDGIPNPGETIAILVMDQDHYRQTSLASGNPCFYKQGFNGRISDSWEHFDYVGASNKYSMLTLAADCDWSESIPLFLEYWLPDGRPNHIIKRAKITIAVKGRDETAPEEKWVSVTGTNLLQAKIQDGSGIKKVTGFFQGKNEKSFEVQLNDDGKNEDRIASDGVFTVLCPPQLFGFYQLTLTMEDEFGNKSTSEIQKPFLLHH